MSHLLGRMIAGEIELVQPSGVRQKMPNGVAAMNHQSALSVLPPLSIVTEIVRVSDWERRIGPTE